MWDRTAPRAKRHLRLMEARGHHAPTTHLIESITGGSHRHSTAKSFTTHAVSRRAQAWRFGSTHRSNHHNAPAHSLTPLMIVSPAPLVHTIHLSPSASSSPLLHSSTLLLMLKSAPSISLVDLLIIHPPLSQSKPQPPTTQVAPSSTTKQHHQAAEQRQSTQSNTKHHQTKATPRQTPRQHEGTKHQGNTKAQTTPIENNPNHHKQQTPNKTPNKTKVDPPTKSNPTNQVQSNHQPPATSHQPNCQAFISTADSKHNRARNRCCKQSQPLTISTP